MSRNRLVARRLTAPEAMDLWGRSDEASAFTRPDYLERLVDEVEWWGVDRSGEVVAAWPLVRAVTAGAIGPPPFCYYVGPMFARSLHDHRYHRSWSAHTAVLSTLVSAVIAVHPRFDFSLPLGMTDIRVLDWWNFDHPERLGFTFRPRYTARLDLREFAGDGTEWRSFESNRRKSIRRWTANPPALVDTVDPERLIELHDQALERTGQVSSPERHLMLRRMIGLVESGAGTVLGFIPEQQSDVAGAIILLDGPEESNAIFYGADACWREEGLITWAVWQGLCRAHTLGKRWFDFNGANSPGRAADKHFYGARAELHFDCRFGAS